MAYYTEAALNELAASLAKSHERSKDLALFFSDIYRVHAYYDMDQHQLLEIGHFRAISDAKTLEGFDAQLNADFLRLLQHQKQHLSADTYGKILSKLSGANERKEMPQKAKHY